MDNAEQPNPTDVTQAEAAAPQKPKRIKKKTLIAAGIFVLLLGGAVGAYFYRQRGDTKTAPVASTTTTVTQNTIPELTDNVDAVADATQLAKFITPKTGETWLAQPKKLPPQNFYKDESIGTDFETEYYEVGSRAGNTIIVANHMEGPGSTPNLFERTSKGVVSIIYAPDGSKPADDQYMNYVVEILNPSVAINKTVHYDSLAIPDKLEVGKGAVINRPDTHDGSDIGYLSSGGVTTGGVKDLLVKKLGASKVIRTESSSSATNLTSIGYSIELPSYTTSDMSYAPVETDLKGFKWSRGNTGVDDTMTAISRGCSLSGVSVTRADTITDNDVQAVGTSPSGKTVYELKDTTNPLFIKAYDEWIDYNKDSTDVEFSNISKADFAREHAVILFKDTLGAWLVYARDKLRPVGGCAKPVVYLYPTTTQKVSVQVGADVKISDPFYDPLHGWQNVLARPDGRLTVNGRQYGSLFWEGPGYGTYPAINSGTIVKTSDALATIRTQLKQQGLNPTEVNDFVAYWQDKLPAKPYTRLTWLNTAQLNQLAPLRVSPAPDTVIRVFLDFEGLDRPIALQPQHLNAVPRHGFTVIEWGGLSPRRLY